MVDGYLPIFGFLSLGNTHIYASILQRYEFGLPLDDPALIREMIELVRFRQDLSEYMILPDQGSDEQNHSAKLQDGERLSIARDLLPFFSTLQSSVKQCRGDLQLRMEEGELSLSRGAFAYPVAGTVMELLGLTRESLAGICRDHPVWPVLKVRSIILEGNKEEECYRCLIYPEGSGRYRAKELSFPAFPWA